MTTPISVVESDIPDPDMTLAAYRASISPPHDRRSLRGRLRRLLHGHLR